MFEFTKKLLFARQLRLEKGSIEMLGQKMVIAPVFTFVSMIKNADNKPEVAKLIYNACKTTNKDVQGFTYRVSKLYKAEGAELIKLMASIATMAGWGEINVFKIDGEAKTAVVHIRNSLVARQTYPSKTAVDHPIRGYMAGAAEVIFNGIGKRNWELFDYIETRCAATGSEFCEFVLDRRSNFKKSTNPSIRKLFGEQVL